MLDGYDRLMGNSNGIMIVAGEASGDALAAKLVQSLNDATDWRRFHFFGAAGPKMRDAGVEAVVRADDLAIMGLVDIGRSLPMFLRTKRKLIDAAVVRKPSLVILVDFPDFNLRLARSLKRRGMKVAYYVSPQLWAWRKYRVRLIKKYVDLLITILPFEKDWYARHGVDHVEYVGNPLVGEVSPGASREELCGELGLDATRPVVALLPGSRRQEIELILPTMLQAAAEVARRSPYSQFLIGAVNEGKLDLINSTLEKVGQVDLPHLRVVVNRTYDIVAASDVAAVASGTATLETAILGTPMVIVYTTAALNYYLLRPLVNVPHAGLINLIAGRRLATELIQNDLHSDALADELERLMEPAANRAMRNELKKATATLGQGGASQRAAEAIWKLIDG